MTQKNESLEILRHLASKPGHDEVKSDFRQLLVAEFDVQLADVHFKQRIEVGSRTDALIGRTVFEAKRDLASRVSGRRAQDARPSRQSLGGDRRASRRHRLGRAQMGRDGARYRHLIKIKETILRRSSIGEFIAWLDGALALKVL